MSSLLGSTLGKAIAASDLFTWFCLEQTGERPREQGGRGVVYQPNGPAFHDFATVLVEVDAGGVIQAMELHLKRSFLDHPSNAVFADDLARSFLRNVLPAKIPEAVKTLTDEIEFHVRTDRPVLTAPRKTPPLPNPPSPGYECYRGTRTSYEAEVSGGSLLMENREIDEARHLVVAVRAAPRSSWAGGIFRWLRGKTDAG